MAEERVGPSDLISEPPSAARLKECRRGAEWAATAAAAAGLGLFEALAEGPADMAGLAEGLEADGRALRILLGPLEALGLVRRDGDRVELTDEGRARYADPTSDVYEAGAAVFWRMNMRSWLDLEEIVRSGAPPGAERDDGPGRSRSVAEFMAAMATKPAEQVARTVDLCLARRPGARTVLDVGGGPGLHSRAFAERGLRATLFDRPETIEHVGEAYGLREAEGVDLVAGDFLETLPDGPFDLVLLSNITHIYGPETNRSLLRRLAEHQPPGGVVAVLDFVRGVSPFAPLFAIVMLVNTEAGNTYALDDYRAWLEAVGYGDVRLDAVDQERELVTAVRTGVGR